MSERRVPTLWDAVEGRAPQERWIFLRDAFPLNIPCLVHTADEQFEQRVIVPAPEPNLTFLGFAPAYGSTAANFSVPLWDISLPWTGIEKREVLIFGRVGHGTNRHGVPVTLYHPRLEP